MSHTRRAHNYLFKVKNNTYDPSELDLLNNYLQEKEELPEYKVALLLVSVNQNYWQYAAQVVADVQKYFLPGHKTDIFLWSDMPRWTLEEFDQKIQEVDEIQSDGTVTFFFQLVEKYMKALYLDRLVDEQMVIVALRKIGLEAEFAPAQEGEVKQIIIKNINENSEQTIRNATKETLSLYKNLQQSCSIQEVEPIEWPYGTLMRYSMFLQQEEALKDYDYIFYLDADMRIVNVVGDEILGQGLTIAPHPGYYLRKELYPPYEPNDQSASFIKRPGKVITMDGQPRFMPFYAAGGFQGGTVSSYIKATKETKKLIDKDLNTNNYIPIWNDETAWNKYVFDCQTKEEIDQTIFLTPSYIYPDSLIKEYYEKFWGRSFPPKIITLTKPFTVQKIDMGKFTTM